MYKKKFEPVITRVKLNPEQAVLVCYCFSMGSNTTVSQSSNGPNPSTYFTCVSGGKVRLTVYNSSCTANAGYPHRLTFPSSAVS